MEQKKFSNVSIFNAGVRCVNEGRKNRRECSEIQLEFENQVNKEK